MLSIVIGHLWEREPVILQEESLMASKETHQARAIKSLGRSFQKDNYNESSFEKALIPALRNIP